MLSRIRIYQYRGFNDLHELQLQMKENSNKERIVMNNSLKKYSTFLNTVGIYSFPDFCHTMKQAGMNRSEICNFILYLAKEAKTEVNLRLCKKSNKYEKNIILTWFAIKYTETFINSITSYLSGSKFKPLNLQNEIIKLISQINRPEINISVLNDHHPIYHNEDEQTNQSNDFTTNEPNKDNDEHTLDQPDQENNFNPENPGQDNNDEYALDQPDQENNFNLENPGQDNNDEYALDQPDQINDFNPENPGQDNNDDTFYLLDQQDQYDDTNDESFEDDYFNEEIFFFI